MHIILHKLEKRIDELIPPLLILLLIAIILELFFTEIAHRYSDYIDILDGVIILVFLIDLGFKYHRIKHIPKFLRTCWLDILAVFPFFLLFRAVELFRFPAIFETGQQILHEGVEIEKEASAVLKETSKVGKVTREGVAIEKEASAILKEVSKEAAEAKKLTRTGRIVRYFKAIGRTPRFLRALPFFEKPTGKHYPREKKK